MSNTIGSIDVQTEIYSSLISALPSMAIYDYVPETATLPYIVIGEDSIEDQSGKNENLYEVTVTVSIYSNYKGMKEAKITADTVINALKALNKESSESRVGFLRLEKVEHRKESDDLRQSEITAVFVAS